MGSQAVALRQCTRYNLYRLFTVLKNAQLTNYLGIGRIDIVENRYIGLKSVRELP